jgi:hypothetical protein
MELMSDILILNAVIKRWCDFLLTHQNVWAAALPAAVTLTPVSVLGALTSAETPLPLWFKVSTHGDAGAVGSFDFPRPARREDLVFLEEEGGGALVDISNPDVCPMHGCVFKCNANGELYCTSAHSHMHTSMLPTNINCYIYISPLIYIYRGDRQRPREVGQQLCTAHGLLLIAAHSMIACHDESWAFKIMNRNVVPTGGFFYFFTP